MKYREPKVSVVMTAYNAAEFVVEAVKSIQNQTYMNWELIIVNDGSTDGTGEILSKMTKNDIRINLISYKKNRGASYASNIGLAQARGEYIARMDADDIAVSTRIEKQVKFLQHNPKIVAVGGQCKLIDKNGKALGMKNFPISHQEIYHALNQYNPIQHPALMINKKLLGKQRIVYHNDVLLAHDLEILYFLSQFGELANLPDTVLQYRIHNDSLSLRNPKETFRHTLLVRSRGVKIYGYKPTVRGLIVNTVQKVVVTLLPSEIIYPLFRLLRMKSVKEARKVIVDSANFVGVRMRERLAYVTAVFATTFTR